MTSGFAFQITYVLLWVLVLLVSIVVLFIGRQLGNVYQRLGPTGAMMANPGPELHSFIEPLKLKGIDGNEIILGGKHTKNVLLVFMSPGCSSCADVASGLKTISRHERGSLNVVLLSMGSDLKMHEEFRSRHGLRDLPYVISDDVRTKMNITGVPYALLLDQSGILRSKGLVNSLVHLESLLNRLDQDDSVLTVQESSTREIGASTQ